MIQKLDFSKAARERISAVTHLFYKKENGSDFMKLEEDI